VKLAITLAAGSLVYGLSRLIVDGLLPGPRVTPARADARATVVTNVSASASCRGPATARRCCVQPRVYS